MRRVDQASKSKVVHFIRITHRDQVEAPFTDWLKEAYELQDAPRPRAKPESRKKSKPAPKKRAKKAIKKKRASKA